MSEETRALLRPLANQFGFDIDQKFTDEATMRDAVRELDRAPADHVLTEEMRLGLLGKPPPGHPQDGRY